MDRWEQFTKRERGVIAAALSTAQVDWRQWSTSDEPEQQERIALARGLESQARG